MMKEIIIFSSNDYADSDSTNYGDCILINTGNELITYDCGHEQHARRVIEYMDKNGYDKTIVILSHNDSDHYNGIPVLLTADKISVIKTTLLLKYKDKILDQINDKRRTRDSVATKILELYDNIAKLSGAPIEDIYEHPENPSCDVEIIGPEFEYMIETVAKRLEDEDCDVDNETAVNATSIQVAVNIGPRSLLLSGDSSFAPIENKVRYYDIIQLPHHGKPKQAEAIFEKKCNQVESEYFISDNTGNSNGGSDRLNTTGYVVKNTKDSGDILYTVPTVAISHKTNRTLGVYL